MRVLPVALSFLLVACNGHGGARDATSPADGAKPRAYAGIAADDTLRFTGTEPFWGGRVTGTALTYETPENPKGVAISVRRFSGNNGLSFSGALAGAPVDMAVTEAPCSDGMSDRIYPFSVTLRLGAEMRQGCGWTDRRTFKGLEKP